MFAKILFELLHMNKQILERQLVTRMQKRGLVLTVSFGGCSARNKAPSLPKLHYEAL